MTWYEDEKQYEHDHWIGPGAPGDREIGGPKGFALLDVFSEGRTTPGWGLAATDKHDGFIREYERGRFLARPRVNRYLEKGRPFAFVMRSMNMLAIDIDHHAEPGSPNGFDSLLQIGFELPTTMAETSKSGAGRHLFYRTPDLWLPTEGYGVYDDVLGLVPGVDIRAVGCVYHYDTQRWNDLPVADAPQELLDMLELRRQKKQAHSTRLAAAAADMDDTEALIVHHDLKTQLAKPIPAGKRNATLYAIGRDMFLSDMPGWEDLIRDRATEIGIDSAEAEKIIANASKP